MKEKALEELRLWGRNGSKAKMRKIEKLLIDVGKHPTTGIGKPERLKHNLKGLWSRRIDRKNRMIYEIDEESSTVFILSLIGHYERD